MEQKGVKIYIFCYILCKNEWAIYFPNFKKETKKYKTETNEN